MSEPFDSSRFDQLISELVRIGRFFAERGWSPAKSSNFSARIDDSHIAITRTGVDKYRMAPEDVIVIDGEGGVVSPAGARASDETLIHTTIYKEFPTAKAVLHTHSPENTRLSLRYLSAGQFAFEGYEMQKGLTGNMTHELKTIVPVLPNAQDMAGFAQVVQKCLKQHKNIHGFLIAGHGLYTWAPDLAAAQRHIESFEFLFRCHALELMGV